MAVAVFLSIDMILAILLDMMTWPHLWLTRTSRLEEADGDGIGYGHNDLIDDEGDDYDVGGVGNKGGVWLGATSAKKRQKSGKQRSQFSAVCSMRCAYCTLSSMQFAACIMQCRIQVHCSVPQWGTPPVCSAVQYAVRCMGKKWEGRGLDRVTVAG